MTRTIAMIAALTMLVLPTARADPGLILDLGDKFDKSLNEGAFTGAERWSEATGGRFRETQLQSEAQREQNLRRMAERGLDPVIVLGFANASTLEKVAPDYPETRFVILDVPIDQPNVRSYIFAEHEGAYLMGIFAALATETGTIGFVGGMDIPIIRRVACGYVQGARATDPDIEVLQNVTGTTEAAWNDPVTGGELARLQIGQGADVVFAAAGGTSLGILQAAADMGVLGIAADSNLNGLHPGAVLTSMLKRFDNAVFDALSAADDGSLSGGVQLMDLSNGGVDYALDEHNAALVSADMTAAVDAAKAAIVAGDIEVHDYIERNECPADR